jgi:hypothetical protein
MGVDHGGVDVGSRAWLLDRADVVARFEEVRRERMAQGVAGRRLRQPGDLDGGAQRPLERALVDVVPKHLPGRAVGEAASRGKDPAPGPLTFGRRVLATECVGERNADTPLEVTVVKALYALEVAAQGAAVRQEVTVLLAVAP